MTSYRRAWVVCMAGAASAAWGQIQNTEVAVAYSLDWTEAHVGPSGTFSDGALGNGGAAIGVLEPGEGALFTVKMRINLPGGVLATAAGGGLGTPLHWAPTIISGSSGVGTLAGLFTGELSVVGDNGAASANGAWSDGTTNFASALRRKLITFTASGRPGNVTVGGSVLSDVEPAQLFADSEAFSHLNDTVCWQGLWVPPPAFRTYSWKLTMGPFGNLSSVTARDSNYDTGYTLPIPLIVPTSFGGTVNIPAIPGPAAGVVVALAGVWGCRRRRFSGQRP